MSGPIGTMGGPVGILMVSQTLSDAARHVVEARFEEWRQNPVRPYVLDAGIRFRQMLPDGTLEPEPPALLPELFESQGVLSETLEVSRDWLPYVVGLSGWVAAIIMAVIR